MKYTAESYQRVGIKFLADRPHCGLFADPGTGKTGMTLAAFVAMKKVGMVNRALVVAPRLVCHNVWPQEVEKFDQFRHLKTELCHGENKDMHLMHEFVEPKADIVLTSPESLKWFLSMVPLKWFTRKRNPLRWPWDVLVIDESSKFKAHDSVRFDVLKSYLPLFTRRIILTGTPAPHSLADLWAQMYLVDQGKTLGPNITTFRRNYCQLANAKFYSYKLLPGADTVIHAKVAPHVLRFDETVFTLPERVIKDVRVTLGERSRKVYDDIENKLFAEIDGNEIMVPGKSSSYLLCRQLANGRMYDPVVEQPDGDDGIDRGRKVHKVHTEKLEAMGDILDELQGKPALIAYYFRHDLTALTAHLERRFPRMGACPYVGSGVSVTAANKHIDDWNTGKLPVLVIHPQSLAHGLNLQAGGNDLIWYGLTDSLEDYQQLIKRLHRRGVVGQVRVHRIIATDTMDEAVIKRLNSKADNQTALLDAVKEYRASKAPPTVGLVGLMPTRTPQNFYGRQRGF